MEQLQHILQNSEVYFFWKHKIIVSIVSKQNQIIGFVWTRPPKITCFLSYASEVTWTQMIAEDLVGH